MRQESELEICFLALTDVFDGAFDDRVLKRCPKSDPPTAATLNIEPELCVGLSGCSE